MNTKKTPKAAAKTAQSKDWAAGLDALADVVSRESFQPTASAFAHAPLVPVSHGPALICDAKVRAGKDAARAVLVRVPETLAARITEHTIGAQSVCLVALADWALDHLLATGQQLTTKEKPAE